MKKYVLGIAAACMLSASSLALAAPPKTESDRFGTGQIEQQANQAVEASKPKHSKDAILFIPQYYNTHNSETTTNLSDNMDGKLHLNSGDTHGAGFNFVATKEVNDMLALSFMYMYYRLDYSGGGLQPTSIPTIDVEDDMTVDSHGFGLAADLDFNEYGRFQANYIQGLDFFSGDRTTTIPMIGVKSETTMDKFSARVSSFMFWYELDLPVTESITLTPYTGWRSLYVHLNNYMGDDALKDDNIWVHLLSGGLKATYRDGLFSFNLRGSVNHRTSHDDAPGYSIRAVEKNVAFPGFNVSLDRTIGSYGAGASYVFPGYGVLFGGYDGFAGSDTNSHMVTVGWVLPF